MSSPMQIWSSNGCIDAPMGVEEDVSILAIALTDEQSDIYRLSAFGTMRQYAVEQTRKALRLRVDMILHRDAIQRALSIPDKTWGQMMRGLVEGLEAATGQSFVLTGQKKRY
jgi:hypothetical protein